MNRRIPRAPANARGFTLLEMIVVLVIIGLIMIGVILAITSANDIVAT
jgi:prepilin-type N-terminal cleavage/methylation domain-containing protein